MEKTVNGMVFQTKRQYVYDKLRDEIQRSVLPPGTKLVLANLADRFGMSPIPVREALRQLEQEGLVDLTPHAPATVRDISADEAIWAAEIRLLLEPAAARAAVGRVPEATMAELRAILDDMDGVIEQGDIERYQSLNFRFHQLIYECGHNKTLLTMLQELWQIARRYSRLTRASGEHLYRGHRDHRRILRALQSGDPDAVEIATREHRARLLDASRTPVRARPLPADDEMLAVDAGED